MGVTSTLNHFNESVLMVPSSLAALMAASKSALSAVSSLRRPTATTPNSPPEKSGPTSFAPFISGFSIAAASTVAFARTASRRPLVRSRLCSSTDLYSLISTEPLKYLSRNVDAVVDPCTPTEVPFRKLDISAIAFLAASAWLSSE
nr:hypothetical protein K4M19_00001 [Agrobacterium fabrum]